MVQKLKLTLIACLVSFISVAQDQAKDPVIMTINNEPVYLSEFVYIYTKNNPCVSYEKEDLDAYMQLFINYKLKVKEAEALGYDTIPKLKNELAQYRNQLSLPYMIDKEKNEALIKEAYERTANEVRAGHIMVRLRPDAGPKDTLIAYEKAMKIRERLLAGEDFETVARSSSEDPSAATNGGDLGYFHALVMVYPFESAAYNLNVGDISMPVRTNFGYHIIKLTDKRPSKGKMVAAHIMILTEKGMSQEDLTKAEQKINDIYAMLEAGTPFEELAGKYSEDQSSKAKGGKLPEFGAGTKQRWVPEFEAAAYSIPADGQYCKPIQSPYGWHIIKRISLTPIGSYDELYRELKLKVERDIRAETTKESFINSLKTAYNFKDYSDKFLGIFYNTMGPEIFAGSWKGLENHANDHEVLCSFANVALTVGDFEKYLINSQTNQRAEQIQIFIEKQFDLFIKAELLKYEDSQLEIKYPEFKSLMQEYRDGILVFDVMQNEIWNKASKDTTGIKAYYEAHKSDFTYPLRYRGDLYRCIDKETAERVIGYLNTDTMDYAKIQMEINTSSELTLIIKRNTFNSQTTDWMKIEKSAKASTAPSDPCKKAKAPKAPKIRTFKMGVNKMFVYKDEYYVFDVEEIMEPRVREFAEAKGLVTAAYQTELENKWLKELRTKYTIVINEDVLYGLGN